MKSFGVSIKRGAFLKAVNEFLRLCRRDGSLRYIERVRSWPKPSERQKAKERLAVVKRRKEEAARRNREKYCDFK